MSSKKLTLVKKICNAIKNGQLSLAGRTPLDMEHNVRKQVNSATPRASKQVH
jgi:hypothetical protein